MCIAHPAPDHEHRLREIGLSRDYGDTYLLTQLVGPAMAPELYLLRDCIDMTEAFRLGLLNWVVQAAQLENKALEITGAWPRARVLPPLHQGRSGLVYQA